MNKKVSTESSNVFDLTALKLLISVVAISLASMMSRASTIPKNFVNPQMPVMAKAKADLLSCPVPYEAEYCLKEKTKNSCGFQEVGILPYLKIPFSSVSTKPYCSTNENTAKQSES